MFGYTTKQFDNRTEYYLDGKLHSIEDLPAIIYSNGIKKWYLNGELHREDGTAVEWPSGYKAWYLNANKISEQEFNNQLFIEMFDSAMEII